MGGAFLSGIGASLCCIGPLLLVSLGLGGVALGAAFEPYRPWLAGAALILLGVSYPLAHRPESEDGCTTSGPCAEHAHRTGLKMIFWIVAVLTAAAITFPYYADLLT